MMPVSSVDRRTTLRACVLVGAAALAILLAPAVQRSARAQTASQLQYADDARIDRAAQWLAAVADHVPRNPDEPLLTVARWQPVDLRLLLVDIDTIVQLTRNMRVARFTVRVYGVNLTIEYTDEQLERLRALACAAGGAASSCITRDGDPLAPSLESLRRLAAAAGVSGDRSYTIRRAAMMHTDVVTRLKNLPRDRSWGPEVAVSLSDGRGGGEVGGSDHWEIARRLLAQVVPPGRQKPLPRQDAMVRDWYVGTLAWLEAMSRYSARHVEQANKLFGDDPDIQFLLGWHHESAATSHVQEGLKDVQLLPGYTFDVGTAEHELQAAEKLYRSVLDKRPERADVRVRFGHVLLQLGRYRDAATELRRALPVIRDAELRYDAWLFIGRAEGALSNAPVAEEAYKQALALYPSAQSPLVALSELAWRRGRRDAAIAVIRRILSAAPETRDDPFWRYRNSAVPDPDERIDALRQRFRRTERP